MMRWIAAAAIISASVNACAAQKLDRIKIYDAEYRRCLRYYLGEDKKSRAMAAVGIHPEDLCRCSTPIFVAGLSVDQLIGLYKGAEGFTPPIVTKFLKSGEACFNRLAQ